MAKVLKKAVAPAIRNGSLRLNSTRDDLKIPDHDDKWKPAFFTIRFILPTFSKV
jgi:hypothetical protein